MNETSVDNVYEVVIVEDDFMVAQLHTSYLSTVPGFKVAAIAHTGSEALAALRAYRPDLLLLDIYLPDMTGIELLRRTRPEFPELDVIMVTAARELETVKTAMHHGVVSYLVKPFEYQALGDRLTHYRHRRSMLDRDSADQQHIDRLFGLDVGAAPMDLPKGFSQETAKAILELLSQDTTISSTRVRQQHRHLESKCAAVPRTSRTERRC